VSTAVFTDLDGTLIYSARHLGGETDTVVVERIGGAPSAWMTRGAADALARLSVRAHVVPTSTRVLEQYLRLDLPGGVPEYAILANGGRILRHGADDSAWSERVSDPSWGAGDSGQIAATLTRHLDGRAWVRGIAHFDRIVCVTSHRGATPLAADVAHLAAVAEEHGYRAFPQGRKTHLIPAHITKDAAAAEVAARLGATRTLAAGDHELDEGLLRWADAAIRPGHGYPVDGVLATASSGVRAGEEILAFFTQAAAAG
jgi:phosphoserine phosphatase